MRFIACLVCRPPVPRMTIELDDEARLDALVREREVDDVCLTSITNSL